MLTVLMQTSVEENMDMIKGKQYQVSLILCAYGKRVIIDLTFCFHIIYIILFYLFFFYCFSIKTKIKTQCGLDYSI